MFAISERARQVFDDLNHFVDQRVKPAEIVFREQMKTAPEPFWRPPILQELKAEARVRGLWNLFLSERLGGAGLTNVEYAPMAERLGRHQLASEAMNCSAPDTGNMEILAEFGTPEQKKQWLEPLLNGEIRSCFAMTEPQVASSDATNIETSIRRDGDQYVINGRKWWISGSLRKSCKVAIVMGKTDRGAPQHRQQSQVLVPMGTPGMTIVRGLSVFGYPRDDGEILFKDCRVPVSNLLGEEGGGFAIAQSRLGPGRIHHCMRTIGGAELALELMAKRATERVTFGTRLADQGVIREWIAEARIEIESARLLVMKTAEMIDTVGQKEARNYVAMIKVAVPQMALKIVDRAIQVHGAAGVGSDFPLANLYAGVRTLRIADGPDEVHKRTIARRELRRVGVHD